MIIKGASSATFVRRVAIALLFVALACVVHVGARDVLVFAVMALAVGLGWLGSMWRYDQKLWSLSQRLEAISGRGHQSSIADRLEENATGLEVALAAMQHRLTERHALSGLPTREPLLFRMEEDRQGLLGALAVADFERLAGFDPAMAERVLLTIVSRILRMVPAERLIAHVDRATGESQLVKTTEPSIEPHIIAGDSQGNLWVDLWTSGTLDRYSPKTGKWTVWRMPGAAPAHAFATYVDDKDVAWVIQRAANAVYAFDTKKEKFIDVVVGSKPEANVRRISGRPGEVWLPEANTNRIMVVKTGAVKAASR